MPGNVDVVLFGGDFVGATISIAPVDDFYVYSGDMINVYHLEEADGDETITASFLLDENNAFFKIPDNAVSVELIWDCDNTCWKQ